MEFNNKIREWAMLCEDVGQDVGNSEVSESTIAGYDVEEVRENLKKLDGKVRAWAEGEGDSWAVYFEIPSYQSPVDSNGDEFDDDADYERHGGMCEDMTNMVFDAVEIRREEFTVEFAYPVDDAGNRLTEKDSWKSVGGVYKIVPKRVAKRMDRRYYAKATSDLYEKAKRIVSASHYDPKNADMRKLMWSQVLQPMQTL